MSAFRCKVKVVLLAFRPEPPVPSAALPLKLAGTVAARYMLPSAGVVADAVEGVTFAFTWCGAVPELLLKLLSPP